MRARRLHGVWGDITSAEILHAAHVKGARMLLLTMPDPDDIHLCVQRAHHLNPRSSLLRARPESVAELPLGVAPCQPEFEGGVEMVRQALVRYQCADDTTTRLVAEVRKEYYGGAVG